MRRRWVESAALILVAVLVIWDGGRIVVRHGAKMGGREAGGYVVLLGLVLAFVSLAYGFLPAPTSGGSGLGWRREKGLGKLLGALGLFAAYVLLIDVTGYLLATALFLAASFRLFGSYRWLPVLTGAVAIASGSAYLWARLGLMLPQGFLPWP